MCMIPCVLYTQVARKCSAGCSSKLKSLLSDITHQLRLAVLVSACVSQTPQQAASNALQTAMTYYKPPTSCASSRHLLSRLSLADTIASASATVLLRLHKEG